MNLFIHQFWPNKKNSKSIPHIMCITALCVQYVQWPFATFWIRSLTLQNDNVLHVWKMPKRACMCVWANYRRWCQRREFLQCLHADDTWSYSPLNSKWGLCSPMHECSVCYHYRNSSVHYSGGYCSLCYLTYRAPWGAGTENGTGALLFHSLL